MGRRLRLLCIPLLVLVAPAVGRAQDVESLKRELETMRSQFEAMKQQYEQQMKAMSDRIETLEARKAAPAAPPVAQAPAPAAPPATPGPTSGPSAIDLLRPRQPFALSTQRGAGQLLFDMGVTGDFIGNLTQHRVERAEGGTFSGRENRFFPREVELNLFGQIDPYARADVRIEAGEDRPGENTSVDLAEGFITLLTLPYGTGARLGQMRPEFGWSNIVHEHDLPWVDRPDAYRVFFGEGGLTEKGVEATWLPDLPFYFEVLAGLFNGDNETAFGRGRLTDPLVTGRVRTYFDLSDTSAIQVGASVADGETPQGLSSTLVGYDVKYKYRPEGWLHPLLTVGSEGIFSIRTTEPGADVGVFAKRTRESFGGYGWVELQPWRRWAVGLRYDGTEYPVNPGWQWAVEPYVTFYPSEFLRFRAAYKHTDRDRRDGFTLNGGDARTVDELLLQATFILGAHPAHPF